MPSDCLERLIIMGRMGSTSLLISTYLRVPSDRVSPYSLFLVRSGWDLRDAVRLAPGFPEMYGTTSTDQKWATGDFTTLCTTWAPAQPAAR